MRNYYNTSVVRKDESMTRVTSRDGHWSVYEAFIRGLPDTYRPSVVAELLAAIGKKDVAGMLRICGDLEALLPEYERSTSVGTVTYDRQVASFLKKFPFSAQESPFDTRAAAISNWKRAEAQCLATNTRLRSLREQGAIPPLFYRMRYHIARVLGGDLNDDILSQVFAGGAHGPGSSITNTFKDGRISAYYKYADLPYSCSARCIPYAAKAIQLNHWWQDFLETSGGRSNIPTCNQTAFDKAIDLLKDNMVYCETEKVTFVPKDARKERTIGICNNLNMYVQLAFKNYIQERLRIFGVDLSDQERNKAMAREGSLFAFHFNQDNPNQFSTIDLSSASDTVSYELVKLVFPPYWFAALDDIRLPRGFIDGSMKTFNKFSAMGNGCTFPIESLIFWAVAQATADEIGYPMQTKDLAVYGDDIIVRYKMAPALIENLEKCGFSVNTEKSFLRGDFKESCGGDYYKGYDVRPFYLTRRIKTYEDVYFVCNSLANLARSTKCYRGYASAYQAALALIPENRRRYGPVLASSSYSPKCGKLVSHPTGAFLSVPLAFMRKTGLSPYLRDNEYRMGLSVAASRSGRRWFSIDNLLMTDGTIGEQAYTTPWYFDFQERPRQYSGNVHVQKMLKYEGGRILHGLGPWIKPRDVLHAQAAASGQITRKGKMTRHVSLRYCSSWDSTWKAHELRRHLAVYAR